MLGTDQKPEARGVDAIACVSEVVNGAMGQRWCLFWEAFTYAFHLEILLSRGVNNRIQDGMVSSRVSLDVVRDE